MATIEQMIAAYRRMVDAVKEADKARNTIVEPISEQMARLETALMERLLADKDMNALVNYYNTGRDELDVLDTQAKKLKAHVAARQEKIETAIMLLLRETKVESMRAEGGTAYKNPQASVKVADWKVVLGHVIENAITEAMAQVDPTVDSKDEFMKLVMQSESWSLLKRAVSKDAVKAHIEATKRPVPGVDYTTWDAVSVRRK